MLRRTYPLFTPFEPPTCVIMVKGNGGDGSKLLANMQLHLLNKT